MRSFIIYGIVLFLINALQCQTIQRKEVNGFITAHTNDIEGVTIYNTSANKGTITNNTGNFVIAVAENDIIEISALQFQPITMTITKEVLMSNTLKVVLAEHINKLKEVLVGNVLTGNLLSDIKNSEGNLPINFYDVGIVGYTGKPATQSERRLNEASGFFPTAIINAISGRTKLLKARVKLEAKADLMQSIKGRLAKVFFESNPLEEILKNDFFYFCADDENFVNQCENKSDFEIHLFLSMKYLQYLENFKIRTN